MSYESKINCNYSPQGYQYDSLPEKENIVPESRNRSNSKEQEVFSKTTCTLEHGKALTELNGVWCRGSSSSTQKIRHCPKEVWIRDLLQRPGNENKIFTLICCAEDNQEGVEHLVSTMNIEELCECVAYIRKEIGMMADTDLNIDINLLYNVVDSFPEENKLAIAQFLQGNHRHYTAMAEWIGRVKGQSNHLDNALERANELRQEGLRRQGYYQPRISLADVRPAPKVTYNSNSSNPHHLKRLSEAASSAMGV
jgi:hypothetical protein